MRPSTDRDSFPIPSTHSRVTFTGRKSEQIRSVSDNGCSDKCEDSRFPWSESDRETSLIPTTFRFGPTAPGVLSTCRSHSTRRSNRIRVSRAATMRDCFISGGNDGRGGYEHGDYLLGTDVPRHNRSRASRPAAVACHLQTGGRMTIFNRFWHWLRHNASSAHHRLMQRYLERRGWVVFYLDEQARDCTDHRYCWMQLYQQQKGGSR